MKNLSDNLRGALFMVFSMTAFTLNDACMKGLSDDLPLFQAAALHEPAAPDMVPADPVRDMLCETEPDQLTPREALDLLYRLKAALDA